MIDGYTDEEFLDKAGLTIRGKITNAALVLLGKDISSVFFDGFAPRITWSLYNADGIYGKILDKNYTTLLYEDKSLAIQTVFLLDRIQKKMPITKEEYQDLKKKGLAEGRYPNIYVSLTVADVVGDQAQYIRNKGLKNTVYKQLILETLDTRKQATQQEILEVLRPALSDVLDETKKRKKVTNLLQAMKNTDETIVSKKEDGKTVWMQSKK